MTFDAPFVLLPSQRGPIRRAGFTLLETILAVALSALLIAAIAAGMRVYTSVVADRRADVVNAQVARVILQRIATDLRGAYMMPEEDSGGSAALGGGTDDLAADGGLGTETDSSATTDEAFDATLDLTGSTVQVEPGLYGNATELQVDVLGQFAKPIRYDMLTDAGLDPLAANLLSEPKVITYYSRSADDNELVGTPLESIVLSESGRKTILSRRVQTRAQAVFDTASVGIGNMQAGEQLLSDQVISIEFAYHDGYDWLDSWDSSLMGGLPIAVNITLTIVDETATDNSDNTTLTQDNVFQQTVRIPAAELPTDDTETMGI